MGIARDDRYVTDAQGRALAGAQVFWCTQPATAPSTPPPGPLASVYADINATQPITQPVLTDGFGHAWAYMDDTLLYTVVVYHPLFGQNPVVLPDQAIGGGGGGGGFLTFAGIPSGTINGSNTVFTVVNGSTPLTVLPAQMTVWLNVPLVLGVGYTVALSAGVVKITFAVAPQPASGGIAGDTIYAQGLVSA